MYDYPGTEYSVSTRSGFLRTGTCRFYRPIEPATATPIGAIGSYARG